MARVRVRVRQELAAVAPAEKVRDGPVGRTVEEQPDRPVGVRVMLQHEHHAAVQVRLLDEERVRLCEEDAALLWHRKLMDPPCVAGDLGRSELEVGRVVGVQVRAKVRAM